MVKKSLLVYHEKQEGALCGLHCLNTLLQSPQFTEIDLMEFGRELDEKERIAMLEGGEESKEFLQFMAEDSGNISKNGNYSIQVLAKALHSKGLDCILVTEKTLPAVINNLEKETGFICNLGSHWFAIRKVEGDWYNFNSTLKEPQHLTDFYLGSYLESVMAEGYSVYVVKGKYPDIPIDLRASADGRWIRVRGNEDDDLKYALEISKKESKESSATTLYPTSSKMLYPNTTNSSSSNSSRYPTVSNPVQSAPLSTNTKTPVLDTTITGPPQCQHQIDMMNHYFLQCMQAMEKLNDRLNVVEKNTNMILENQRRLDHASKQ